jgi:O-antigen/teichoic acid export membrane protein
MDKRQTGRNVMASVLQILINGGILFVLYRFILVTIGAKQFGIWSLVMAFTSFASVANLGFAGSVVKFVAQSMAYGDSKKTALIVQTATISITGVSGVVMLVAFPFIRWGLKFVLEGDSLASANILLPFSLLAFWVTMIAGVFYSTLDGYKRLDMRSALMICGGTLNLLMCFFLVPRYGLLGLAYAGVGSNISAMLLGWYLVRRNNALLPLLPLEWNATIFKEIACYATKFQIISLALTLGDPITKVLLGKFGGLSIVTFYEMANRLIQQLRALMVAAYQALVPIIAELKEKSPEKIPELYSKSYDMLYYIALPAFGLLILWIPLISRLWIGHIEDTFVVMGQLLAAGWFLNTLAVPAYMASLGTGELKWNLVGHIIMAVLNLLLGLLGGVFFGGYGVVIGTIAALLFGSAFTSVPFQNNYNIQISRYLPQTSRPLTLFLIPAIIIVRLPFVNAISKGSLLTEALLPAACLSVAVCMMLSHPLRQQLQDFIILGVNRTDLWTAPANSADPLS